MSRRTLSLAPDEMSVDVYAGMRRLGEVRQEPSGGWSATTDEDVALGIFTTREAAQLALLHAFAERQNGG